MVIKSIADSSSRIYLCNVWRKFNINNIIMPEFIRENRLSPLGAKLSVRFMGNRFACEGTLWRDFENVRPSLPEVKVPLVSTEQSSYKVSR